MSEILNNLNDDYKQKKKEATSREEKHQIKQDYGEMKGLIKGADKLLKKHDEELKKMNAKWDKFDLPNFDEYKANSSNIENDETLKEMNEKIEVSKKQFEEQKKHSDEVMRKADETIKQIDKKIAELEKAESLEKTKQDYKDWENTVLERINIEEYQTIEEAKEKAKNIIKSENDLTSVWEKEQKYYVVLSKDREVAFRNNYKEIIKYYDLVEEKHNSINNNLFEQDENGAFLRLVIPANFVSTILSPKKTDDMDLRGKKNDELTTDEVIVLKKYAYELTGKKEEKENE